MRVSHTDRFLARMLIAFLLQLLRIPASAQWAATAGPPNAQVNALLVHEGAVFAGTSKPGGLFKSVDSGKTWRAAEFRMNESIFEDLQKSVMSLASLGRFLFAGTSDSLLRSEDGGESWLKTPKGPSGIQYMAAGEGVVYAAFFDGLYRSLDSGASWTTVALAHGSRYIRSLATRDSLVYVGEDGGIVQHSADRGETWSQDSLPGGSIYALAMSPGLVFAGDQTGTVHVLRDGGATWSASEVVFAKKIRALAGEPKSLFAATEDGVYRSIDTAKSWSLLSDSRQYTLDRVFYAVAAQGGTAYAGGWGGAIRVSGNAGWTEIDFGLGGSPITGLGVAGTRIYAGYDTKGFRGSDRGGSWRGIQSYAYIVPTAYLPLGSGILAAAIGDEVDAGIRIYSDDDLTLTGSAADSGLGKVNVYALERIGPVLFAASEKGVYRSLDSARSWTAATQGMGAGPARSLAAQGSLLYACDPARGVFLSANQGGAWTAVGAGALKNPVLALAGAGDAVVAAADSGRQLMRSGDQGKTWTPAQTGLTPQRVNVLASSGAIVLAGTSQGVYRSLDGGLTWGPFATGMFSLVADGVSPSADETITALAIGTTLMAAGTARGTVWQRPIADLSDAVAGRHVPVRPRGRIGYFDGGRGRMLFALPASLPHADRAVDAAGSARK